MTVWAVTDVNLGTSYQAFNINVEKSLRGFNNATFDSTSTIPIDALVDIKYNNAIVIRGYIKNIRENEDGTKTYTVVERAIELKDTILTDANGNYKFFKQDTVDNLVDWILTNTGWTRASTSSDTTSLFLSFSFTSVYNALMKILHELRGHNVWFDNINQVVYFGSQRDNEGTIIPLKKEIENDTHKYNVGKVIVIGKYEDVWAEYGTGTRTVVYKYTDAKTQQECQSMAERLYNELNQTYNRITATLTVHTNIDEGDLVTVDGTNYIVQEVTITEYDMKVTLNQAKRTLLDVLSDKLTEVYGTVGVATAFDDIIAVWEGDILANTSQQIALPVDQNTSYTYYDIKIVLDAYGGGSGSVSFAALSNELYIREYDSNILNTFGSVDMASYSPIAVPSDKDYQGAFVFLLGGWDTAVEYCYLVLSDNIIYDQSSHSNIIYDGSKYILSVGMFDGFYNDKSGIISYDSANGYQYLVQYSSYGHYYKNATDGGYIDGLAILSDGYFALADANVLKFNTTTNSYTKIGTFTGTFNKYTNIVHTRSDGCGFTTRVTTSPYKIIYNDYDNTTSTLTARELVTSTTIAFPTAKVLQDSNGVIYILFTDNNGNLYCIKSSDHFATWSEINGTATYDSSLGAVDVSNLTPLTLPTVNNSSTIFEGVLSDPTIINSDIYFAYYAYDSTTQTTSLVFSKIDTTTSSVTTLYEFTNVTTITYIPSVYYDNNGYYYVVYIDGDFINVKYSTDLINWIVVLSPSNYETNHDTLTFYSEQNENRASEYILLIRKAELVIDSSEHIHNHTLFKVDTTNTTLVNLGDIVSGLVSGYTYPSICYALAEKDESVNTGFLYSYGNVRGKNLYVYLIEAYSSTDVYDMYGGSYINVFLVPKLIDTIPTAPTSNQSSVSFTVDLNGTNLCLAEYGVTSCSGKSEYTYHNVESYLNMSGNNILTITPDTDVHVTVYAYVGGVRYA